MLPKLNVPLLYKDLISLCVTLRHFPIVGDAEDTFAERDDDYGLADRRAVCHDILKVSARVLATETSSSFNRD